MLPDFIIIGARCCGTTSLFRYLRPHPELILAVRKEVHFFDDHYDAGINWYRAHFPLYLQRMARRMVGRKLVTGEASPYYLFHPLAARRAAEWVPGARLVLLLRHPVDRAYSQYQQARLDGLEDLPFETAIDQEPSRLEGEEARLAAGELVESLPHKQYSYLARGHYAEQLEVWLDQFARERLLILSSEALFTTPEATMNRVCTFLGLEAPPPATYPAHNVGGYDQQMSPSTRRRLLQYFAPHNKRLFELIGEEYDWSE